MNPTLCCVVGLTALSITVVAPRATARQVSSVGPFDVCSLLSNSDAASITGDQHVVKRGGPPGFLCAWNSPGGEGQISHDIVIMLWTQARMQQLKGRPAPGLEKDPKLAGVLNSGSPLGFFQGLSKAGKSCQGYAGDLPCTEVDERIALYKHTNAYDYVVVIFAQREEGHGDAGIVRLVLDAAHVANRITSRLP